MKMRIMGRPEECAAMVTLIRDRVPNQYIRSISRFYPNRRPSELSNEGRVYCEFENLSAIPGLVPREKR